MYAKVFAQIYDGTLCTKGPWQALVTFQQLLVLADQDGNVDMTAGAIARRTTIPLEIIEQGLSVLLLPDPESRTPGEEGRRILPLSEGRTWGWRIVNYKHYRALKREEDRREYHRVYWHTRNKTQPTQHTQPNQPIAEAKAEAKAEASSSTKKAATASLAGLEGIPAELLDDWKAVRASKRAGKITKTVLDGLSREAAKAGLTPAEAVRVCAERGWQNFNAEWHRAKGGVVGHFNKQEALEASNKAVGDAWLKKMTEANGAK